MNLMQGSGQQFKVLKNGQEFGPYPKEILLENVKMRNFTLDDLVWQPNMKNWEPLRYQVTLEERKAWGISVDGSPHSPHETAGTLERLLDLSPLASTLVIIVDIMVFILAIPTLGLIIFAVLLLSVVTFLIQKFESGDDTSLALRKTLTVTLLTGIPVPVCAALILYFKFFGKKR